MRGGAWPLLGLVLLACGEGEAELTQVVIAVGGDSAVRVLDVRVYDDDGLESASRNIDLTQRVPGILPTSFTVVQPKHGADHFHLTIEGLEKDDSGATRAHSRYDVRAHFTPGETTLLPVVLAAGCSGFACPCETDEPCDSTCSSDLAGRPSCVPTRSYAVLPTVVPGKELQALRDGTGGCERGAFPGPDGCEDVDECAFRVDECDHSPPACVNELPEDGRYDCECPPGYSGTGYSDDRCVPCDEENPCTPALQRGAS